MVPDFYSRLQKVGIWAWDDLCKPWGCRIVIFQLSGFYCNMAPIPYTSNGPRDDIGNYYGPYITRGPSEEPGNQKSPKSSIWEHRSSTLNTPAPHCTSERIPGSPLEDTPSPASRVSCFPCLRLPSSPASLVSGFPRLRLPSSGWGCCPDSSCDSNIAWSRCPRPD